MTNPLLVFADSKRWVNWKSVVPQDGKKPTKVPFQPNGSQASTTDINTWSTYPELHQNGFNGAGIVFTPDQLLLGVDGDRILKDGAITDAAFRSFVESANTYTEKSPSGVGLHVYLTLTEPLDLAANRHGGYECYTTARFFTVTFDAYIDRPIRTVTPAEATELLKILGYPWNKAPKKKATAPTEPIVVPPLGMDDGTLLNIMFRSKNGTKIKALYDGDTSAYDNDDSAADMALCCHLTWWTNHDAARVERIWLASALGKREKVKDRKDYRDRTVETALSYVDGDFSGNKPNERESSPDDTTISDLLIHARLTDVGNAECFKALHAGIVHFCHTRDRWIVWNGERHQIDDTGESWRLMLKTIRLRQSRIHEIVDDDSKKRFAGFVIGSENEGKLQSALSSASKLDEIATTIDLYDCNPMLANAGPVALDLLNVAPIPNKQSDYITRALGCNYDPAATCPRWQRFLMEVFGNNQELISYIARASGYSLTGDTREQVMFLCYGSGSNGKSVFLTTLARILGEYSESRSFATFDADERNRVGDDLAGLKGIRLLTVIETAENKRLNEARVKSLTGQDVINCRFLYGEYFSFRPEFKLWIAFNSKPTVRGTDRGIWRRIQLIPFDRNFEGHEDKVLDKTLKSELPGILNWVLEGLREWHRQGLNPPAIVMEATREYKHEMDVVSAFVAEMCVLSPSATVRKGMLYEAFLHWSGGSKNVISKIEFGKQLKLMGIKESTIGNARTWDGINLEPQMELHEQN